MNPDNATRAVLKTLAKHIDAGEYEKVVQELPKGLRGRWPTRDGAGAADAAAQPRA